MLDGSERSSADWDMGSSSQGEAHLDKGLPGLPGHASLQSAHTREHRQPRACARRRCGSRVHLDVEGRPAGCRSE